MFWIKLVHIQKSYDGNPDRHFKTEDFCIHTVDEWNRYLKDASWDEMLIGECTQFTSLFRFDSIVILQNKRDQISQKQMKITEKMSHMFLA